MNLSLYIFETSFRVEQCESWYPLHKEFKENKNGKREREKERGGEENENNNNKQTDKVALFLYSLETMTFKGFHRQDILSKIIGPSNEEQNHFKLWKKYTTPHLN